MVLGGKGRKKVLRESLFFCDGKKDEDWARYVDNTEVRGKAWERINCASIYYSKWALQLIA
jgi:hypothetical protein